MLDLFEKKQRNDFSDKIRKVFNLLTISRKYRIVGSAGYKNLLYVADYDLNELYKKRLDNKSALDLIYNMFKSKFQKALKDPNCIITDFKCGLNTNGDPLRWDKNDMKNGYKILADGRKIAFQDCILQKAPMKLDVVEIIDGVYTEFSDNYNIKLGNEANFFPHDLATETIKNNLKHSYEENFYIERNLFKGLKRAFSYYIIDGETKNRKPLTKLINFLNTKVGLLYREKSQLKTIRLVIENKSGFRKPRMSDIKRNIQIILKNLEELPLPKTKQYLVEALKSKTMKSIEKKVAKAEEDLYNIINSATLDFVMKNKDVPIY